MAMIMRVGILKWLCEVVLFFQYWVTYNTVLLWILLFKLFLFNLVALYFIEYVSIKIDNKICFNLQLCLDMPSDKVLILKYNPVCCTDIKTLRGTKYLNYLTKYIYYIVSVEFKSFESFLNIDWYIYYFGLFTIT